MINIKIKRLIYILLMIINIYLLFLIIPKLTNVFQIILSIIFPFLIAFVIAFILQPIIVYFQKLFKKRWIAVFIVILILLLILFIFFKYLLNIVINEMTLLANKMPELLKELENLINKIISSFPLLHNYEITLNELITSSIYNDSNSINEIIFSNQTIDIIINIGKYIIVTPIILLYILLDYEKILCKIRNYLIRKNKIRFKNYLSELNKIMSSYISGVLLVMIILFMVFNIIFIVLGIENGFIFALIISFTNVIPYVGSWIGCGIPILYVLVTNRSKTVVLLILCIIIQTLEADVLTPLIQGKKIKIHPLIILLSLMVFTVLFGFIGMIIAVPLAAIINITLKHYPLEYFKNKYNEKLLK